MKCPIYEVSFYEMSQRLNVASSTAKIDENFANFFLKTKAKIKCFTVLKCTCKGLQKSIYM